jgi:hypothetical protein
MDDRGLMDTEIVIGDERPAVENKSVEAGAGDAD